MYNLDDSIEGLDVIDFPGVDDRDESISDLADLLITLAQIVIFVVDYRCSCINRILCKLRISGYPYHLVSAVTHFDVILQEDPHRVSQEVAGETAGRERASSGLSHVCRQTLR